MPRAVSAALDSALRSAELCADVRETADLSGGCIHRVQRLVLADGTRVVVKVNHARCRAMFDEEATGLRVLAETHTVIVPRPLAVVSDEQHAVLLMTCIDPPVRRGSPEAMWRAFGEDLASLHRAALPVSCADHGYGFLIDNHLGATAQPNGWQGDWVTFNREHRLGHQLRLIREQGVMNTAELRPVEAVMEQLDALLPHQPRCSLLHGDLWSGNVLPTARNSTTTCAVIDPAAHVGDALADIAMMRLFGGFPRECYDAWAARTGIDPDSAASRTAIAVYQLYHVLNHVTLFGRGYVGQALALAHSVLR
jgi:fructosamine-3-kinase